MKLTIIAAKSANGVIGKNNDIPWKLPSDLKHFKKMTLGHPMILGRKTFDSFGGRPLPKRPHIIMTNKLVFDPEYEDQVFVVNSAEQAMETAASITVGEVFVIGGATIYEQFMKYATRMILTELVDEFDGDTYFPEIGPEWEMINEEIPDEPELPYVIRTYIREL